MRSVGVVCEKCRAEDVITISHPESRTSSAFICDACGEIGAVDLDTPHRKAGTGDPLDGRPVRQVQRHTP
jgi:hypothetical protein